MIYDPNTNSKQQSSPTTLYLYIYKLRLYYSILYVLS